jgi:hypothetical protein
MPLTSASHLPLTACLAAMYNEIVIHYTKGDAAMHPFLKRHSVTFKKGNKPLVRTGFQEH